MRLVTKQSGRFTYLYAIKGYLTDDGKSTTKVVKKFGTVEELREKLNGEDPIEWAKAQVARMTEQENEESKKVVIECNPKALMSKGEQRSYNGGYLFLQKMYYDLTNYFFEWEEEGGLVQYGPCKEGRPLPNYFPILKSTMMGRWSEGCQKLEIFCGFRTGRV